MNASWNMCICAVCVCLLVYMHGYYHVCALIAGVHLAAEPSSGAPGVGVARAPPTPSNPPTLLSPPPPSLLHFSAVKAPAHLNGADVQTSRHSPPSHPVAQLTPAAVGGTNQSPKINSVLPRKKIIFCSAADRVTLALCNKLMNVL